MSGRESRQDLGILPTDVTSFVGRRQELAKARRLLGHARLVTLTGMGGVGKTRLALQLADSMRRTYTDGIWLTDLTRLHDATLLDRTIAATFRLADLSARPLDSLLDFIKNKKLLLLLDNCEHLLDPCAILVNKMLAMADGIRIVATSRQPLGIAGEHVFPVPPMSLPSPDLKIPCKSINEYEAIHLFVERAVAAVPDFTITDSNRDAVVGLCQRLDGIPLAIELAATRLRSLSPDQILERLDDRFLLLTTSHYHEARRQQTLQATIDWSYDLCSAEEQALWGRLSIFCGGFDLQAVENVCYDQALPPENMLELVANLIDKSIIIRNDMSGRVRYRLVETIRQYGNTILVKSGQDEIFRRQHRDYYQKQVMNAGEIWFEPGHEEWYTHLHLEHANLQAALKFSLAEPGEARNVLEMITASWSYWVIFGRLGEARHWLHQALEQDRDQTRQRAKALWVSGQLALIQGDIATALPLLEECHTLAKQLGDAPAIAHVIENLGIAALFQGDYTRAVQLLGEASDRHRAVGTPPSTCSPMYLLALDAAGLGDTENANIAGAEAMAISKTCDQTSYRPLALWVLGLDKFWRGDLPQAAALVRESLQVQRSTNALFPDEHGPSRAGVSTAHCLEVLAWIAAAEGRPEHSAQLLGTANTLWRSLGSPMPRLSPFADFHASCESLLHEALDDEKFTTAFRRGAGLTLSEGIAYALDEETTVSHDSPSAPQPTSPLTRREREVAELVAQGLSNKEIATALVIAQRTAEGHVENILAKLGFDSRVQVASWIITSDER